MKGAAERKGAIGGISAAIDSTTPMRRPPASVPHSEATRPTMAAAIAGITRKVSTVGLSRTRSPSIRPLKPHSAPLISQATVSTSTTDTPSIADRSRSLASERISNPARVRCRNKAMPTVARSAASSASSRVPVNRMPSSSMPSPSVASVRRRGLSIQSQLASPSRMSGTFATAEREPGPRHAQAKRSGAALEHGLGGCGNCCSRDNGRCLAAPPRIARPPHFAGA